MSGGWHGVDLDGTLAHYPPTSGKLIGAPVRRMRLRVVRWLGEGRDVRIVTARTLTPEFRAALDRWCRRNVGRALPVTNAKDLAMIELWDDRVVQVETNTGRRMDGRDG
jgi:hypothetical protein